MFDRHLTVQRDGTILLAAKSGGLAARDELRRFAELVSSSGAYHQYRLTDVSLWAAAAAGLSAGEIIATLDRLSAQPCPAGLAASIQERMARYGVVTLEGGPGCLRLRSSDERLLRWMAADLGLRLADGAISVPDAMRGVVKSALLDRGYPVRDVAGVLNGEHVAFRLRASVELRPYQRRAVESFGAATSGGVILLPCGAGKTVVGVALAAALAARTLVISPSRTIGDQWAEHFPRLTTIAPGDVRVFDRRNEPAPVTIATYQMLTRQAGGAGGLAALLDLPWGLVIYDEVHSLPADVFRLSASVQSRRRLGLTATLVREDGRERDVFSLVGPPVFSVPWRDLERHGWIAPVDCVEIRLGSIPAGRDTADRVLLRKIDIARRLLWRHPDQSILVAAHHLREVAAISRALHAPAVTGDTPLARRRELYDAFRRGDLSVLVLSRVANVGVDLPEAGVLIQVSGAFGSRQEEAQRVGRLLRPKESGERATFYSLVATGSREAEFAARRQRFLVDQGYRYRILRDDELDEGAV